MFNLNFLCTNYHEQLLLATRFYNYGETNVHPFTSYSPSIAEVNRCIRIHEEVEHDENKSKDAGEEQQEKEDNDVDAGRDEQEEEEEDLADSNAYADNYEGNVGSDEDKDSVRTQEEEEDVEDDKDKDDIKNNDFLSAQGDLQDRAAAAAVAASAAKAIAGNINSLAVPTADSEDLRVSAAAAAPSTQAISNNTYPSTVSAAGEDTIEIANEDKGLNRNKSENCEGDKHCANISNEGDRKLPAENRNTLETTFNTRKRDNCTTVGSAIHNSWDRVEIAIAAAASDAGKLAGEVIAAAVRESLDQAGITIAAAACNAVDRVASKKAKSVCFDPNATFVLSENKINTANIQSNFEIPKNVDGSFIDADAYAARLPSSIIRQSVERPVNHSLARNDKVEVRHIVTFEAKDYPVFADRIKAIFHLKKVFPFLHKKEWTICENELGSIWLTHDTITEEDYYDVSRSLNSISNFENRKLDKLFSRYYPVRASKLHSFDDMKDSNDNEKEIQNTQD